MYNENYILNNLEKIYQNLDSNFDFKNWRWKDCVYHVIPMSLQNIEKEKKYIGYFYFQKSVIVFKSTGEELNFNWIIEVDDIKKYGVIKTIHDEKNWVTLVFHLDKGKRMVKILLDPKQSFTFLSAYKTWISQNTEKFRGLPLR